MLFFPRWLKVLFSFSLSSSSSSSFLLLFLSFVSSSAGSREFRNNWAVIVSTSRYWYNYRHTANALSVYHTVKRLGIPDSRILLMLADDHACSPRNSFPGQIFNGEARRLNLYGGSASQRKEGTVRSFEEQGQQQQQHYADVVEEEVEVDYRGDGVQVDAFLRLLAGRHSPDTPRGKRLLTDENSHVLLYLSGHGGEGFLKFQDWEEISGEDLASAIAQMKEQRRFKRLLLIAETCQGSSLLDAVHTPDVLGIASSAIGESSYSHHSDSSLGVSVIDRWTYYTLQFFEKFVLDPSSPVTFETLMESYSKEKLMSTATVRTDLFGKSLRETRLTEFFAATGTVQRTHQLYPLPPPPRGSGAEEEHEEREEEEEEDRDRPRQARTREGEEEGTRRRRRGRSGKEEEEDDDEEEEEETERSVETGPRSSRRGGEGDGEASFFSCFIPSYYSRHFRLFKDGEEADGTSEEEEDKEEGKDSATLNEHERQREKKEKKNGNMSTEAYGNDGDRRSRSSDFFSFLRSKLPLLSDSVFPRDEFLSSSPSSTLPLLLLLFSLGLASSAGASALLP